uniref:Arb2 domain-containing protein n=1 Tax=Arcella intermedia TaxID=1963864 RepID=A0A6B2LF01_9EUKA
MGDVIVKHIQGLMVSEYGLEEVLLPLHPEDGPKNNIFVSPNWQTAERLMLLIQGSGAVRAGQWARALCINESLDIGSVLPYIKECQNLSYGVIVFNPNLNSQPKKAPQVLRSTFLTETSNPFKSKPGEVEIPENESPPKHVIYVWDNFVEKSKTKVSVVAHSAGGHGTCILLKSRAKSFHSKVCGIAFTDSAHYCNPSDPEHQRFFLTTKAKNWVKSDEPLDTLIATLKHVRVSAET